MLILFRLHKDACTFHWHSIANVSSHITIQTWHLHTHTHFDVLCCISRTDACTTHVFHRRMGLHSCTDACTFHAAEGMHIFFTHRRIAHSHAQTQLRHSRTDACTLTHRRYATLTHRRMHISRIRRYAHSR